MFRNNEFCVVENYDEVAYVAQGFGWNCGRPVFLVLSILAQSILGEFSLFLILPGAGIFIYLNPELMRGD